MVKRLAPLIFFAVITLSAHADEPRRSFPTGYYKQDGACLDLVALRKDLTGLCAAWIGVWAKRDDVPEFMFSAGQGSLVVFITSDAPVYSRGNTKITYPVGTVLWMEAKHYYDVYGECTLEIGADRERVSCEAWNDQERTRPLFSAHFTGDGAWFYRVRP